MAQGGHGGVLVGVAAAGADVLGVTGLGAGGLHNGVLVVVAQGVEGLGHSVAAAGAGAGLLAVLGAGGSGGDYELAHVVAQGGHGAVLVGVAAAGADVLGVAAFGAGGLHNGVHVVVAQRLQDFGLAVVAAGALAGLLAGGGAAGLGIIGPLAHVVAQSVDGGIELLGELLILEALVVELAVRIGAVPVGFIAGLGTGRIGGEDQLRIMDVYLADPEVAAEFVPVAVAVGVEVDHHVAGMVFVNGILGAHAVGIPDGDGVVLHLDDLDLLVLVQSGLEHELVLRIVRVDDKEVRGVDAVHVPIRLGGKQIIAVVEQTDVLGPEHRVADAAVGHQIVAARNAGQRIDAVLFSRGLRVVQNGDLLVGRVVASGAGHVVRPAGLGTGRGLALVLNQIVAQSFHRLGLGLAADGALVHPLAGLDAGGLAVHDPVAPGVARSRNRLGLCRVAVETLVFPLALIGAGGIEGHEPLAPAVVAGIGEVAVLGLVAAGALVGGPATVHAGGLFDVNYDGEVVAQGGLAGNLDLLAGQLAFVDGVAVLGAGGLVLFRGTGGIEVAARVGCEAIFAAGTDIVDHVVVLADVVKDVQISGLFAVVVDDKHVVVDDVQIREIDVVAVHIDVLGDQFLAGPLLVQIARGAPGPDVDLVAVGLIHNEDRDD